MRIGIVTFWQSGDNYGQQLQCWALQRYLKGIGHEPFLIRYLYKEPLWRKCLKLMAKTVLVYPLLRWWRHREVRRMEAVNRVKNKERRFEEFRKSHIYQTQRIYGSLKELRKDPPTADLYITGSDQVWHPVLLRRKDDRAYWLDFGSDRIRRIAYAASFGSDQCPLRLQAELTARLSRFDILSVREESGVAICQAVGKEAVHVLDPPLLLAQEEYLSLSRDIPPSPSPYIFIYSINISSNEEICWPELRGFTEREGLSLVVTPASGYLPGRELFQGVEYRYATIPEWLSLIRHSGLVVTTSFHGVACCILFHKPFVYFPLSGTHAKGNSRVLNMLSKLSLSDNVWKAPGDFERIYHLPIDWDKIEESLAPLRERSVTFLREALK